MKLLMDHLTKSSLSLAIVASLGVWAAAPAQAGGLYNDGSIFLDNFDGSALDSNSWNVWSATGGTLTVGSGLANMNTDSTRDVYYTIGSKTDLDFSASPTEWVAETRFRINSLNIAVSRTDRNLVLLSGANGFSDDNDWRTQGFDLRVTQTSSTTYGLGWNGWDNATDTARAPINLYTAVTTGEFHTLQAHRKPDGNVDVYYDGNLIATKPLLRGLNPDRLLWGDFTTALSANFDVDYFKAGLVPEPTCLALLTLGGAGALTRRRAASCKRVSPN